MDQCNLLLEKQFWSLWSSELLGEILALTHREAENNKIKIANKGHLQTIADHKEKQIQVNEELWKPRSSCEHKDCCLDFDSIFYVLKFRRVRMG